MSNEPFKTRVLPGNVCGICGHEVIIDIGHGLIKYLNPEEEGEGSNRAAWDIYCRKVKITIEEISDEEFMELWPLK